MCIQTTMAKDVMYQVPWDTRGRNGVPGESARTSWELGVTVPVGLFKIKDKADGQKPKVPRWLETRLDKGMLGPD